jgi:hypothetical protein
MEALFHHYCIAWSPSALLEEPGCLSHVDYCVPKRAPFGAQSALDARQDSHRRRPVGLSEILREAGPQRSEQPLDQRYIDN